MRKKRALLVLAGLTVLGLALWLAAVEAEAIKPPKLVVRHFHGPVSVEGGNTVRLAAHNLLPEASGTVTLIQLDAVTGDFTDATTFDLDPRTGGFFDVTYGFDTEMVSIVRFESGDTSAVRGPALVSSIQVLTPEGQSVLWGDWF